MAKLIWMRFGTVGQTGPGIRQVVGFWDRSVGRGNFGGAPLQPMGTLRCSCAKVREPSKLRFGVERGVGRGIGVLG